MSTNLGLAQKTGNRYTVISTRSSEQISAIPLYSIINCPLSSGKLNFCDLSVAQQRKWHSHAVPGAKDATSLLKSLWSEQMFCWGWAWLAEFVNEVSHHTV